jgi:hypothetical protein
MTESVSLDDLGLRFPFVGREDECREMLRHLWNLSVLQGRARDQVKRKVYYPVCTGLSGPRFIFISDSQELGRRDSPEIA